MTTQNIILIAVGISQIIFGCYVLFNGKFKLVNWLFFLFAWGVALWNISILAIDSGWAAGQSAIVIWDRITYLSVPIMIVSMLLYIRHLLTNDLGRELRHNWILWFFLLYSLFSLAITPTNLLSANPGVRQMVPGPLYPIFGGYVFLSALYILYTCFIGLKISHGRKRQLFSRILIGIGLTALGGLVFNIILPLVGHPSLSSLGAASSFFMVIFVGLGALGYYLFSSFLVAMGIMLVFILVFVMALVGILVTS